MGRPSCRRDIQRATGKTLAVRRSLSRTTRGDGQALDIRLLMRQTEKEKTRENSSGPDVSIPAVSKIVTPVSQNGKTLYTHNVFTL